MRQGPGARLWLLALPCVLACESGKGPNRAENRPREAAPTTSARPTFVTGPSGGAPIADFLRKQVEESRAERRKVLVYVGAPWCEPCQRFHRAATAGELDPLLAGTRIVEFDLDADKEALERAGYSSRLIPLFAVPRADGTCSERRIEGSVKGERAVQDDLVPRLRALLEER